MEEYFRFNFTFALPYVCLLVAPPFLFSLFDPIIPHLANKTDIWAVFCFVDYICKKSMLQVQL